MSCNTQEEKKADKPSGVPSRSLSNAYFDKVWDSLSEEEQRIYQAQGEYVMSKMELMTSDDIDHEELRKKRKIEYIVSLIRTGIDLDDLEKDELSCLEEYFGRFVKEGYFDWQHALHHKILTNEI